MEKVIVYTLFYFVYTVWL